MKKFMERGLCVLLAVMLVMAMLPAVNSFAAKEMFQISTVAVTGIDLPLAGAKPDFTAEVSSSARYELAENAVVWEEYDEDWVWQSTLTANSTFKKGNWYVVFIKLNPKSGYSFTDTITSTINGNTADADVSGGNNIEIYTSFQCTNTAITQVDLNVVMPTVGQTPTFAKVDTLEYESANNNPKLTNQANGVVWTNMSTNVNLSNSNPFKKATQYSVTYTLYAKSGYSFVKDLKATVNGKTALVRQVDNYVLIRLENLTPTYKSIPSVAVTDVTAPAVGKTPDYTITIAGEHCGVVNQNSDYWVNGVGWVEFIPGNSSGKMMKKTDTFKAGNKYAIIMDISATTEGYQMVKDSTTATVNGKSATLSIEADGLTGRMIYTFSALSQMTLSKIELNVTAPAAGAKPAFDKIDGAGYYSDNNGGSAAAFKNGIAWFKSASAYIGAGTTETFEAGKDYTLKISLVTKDAYAFSKTLSATINGKTATVTAFEDGSVLLEVVLSTPKAPHTHTPSGWQTDDEYHWKTCTDATCGSILGQKQMHLNSDSDGKCDTCGYQLPIEVPDDPVDPPVIDPIGPPVTDPTDPPATDPTDPPATDPTDPPADAPTEPPVVNPAEPSKADPTAPASTTPAGDETEEPAANNGWVWIVVGGAMVILAVVVVLFIKKKK